LKKKEQKNCRFLGTLSWLSTEAQRKNNIQNIRLDPILRDIEHSFSAFEWMYFHHILREINTKVDELSKKALDLHNGALVFYEFLNGVEMEVLEFRF
jgi:hypothetical protein